MNPTPTAAPCTTACPAAQGAPFVAVLSGKGGVGKTNVVANLAIAVSGLGARVLLVDGDLGLANVDVLLGLAPRYSVADVLAGRCGLEQALVEGPRGVRILPAASGRPDLAALDPGSLERLLGALREAARDHDLVLVDAGAGVGPSVLGLASGSDRVVVVTTPEPTSLADAYAAVKLLHQLTPDRRSELLVNAARDETEARETHAQLQRVARRFLGAPIGYLGFLPADPRLAAAVARQRAVVEMYPASPSARRLVALAADLLREGRAPLEPPS